MHIALDARWIFPRISGIGRYTQELIQALYEVDQDNRFLLLFDHQEVLDRTLAETGLAPSDRWQTELLGYGVFSAANQLRLPGFLRRRGVDVYHSTNYMTPLAGFARHRLSSGPKLVLTIHDLIPLLFRDHAPRSKKSRLFPVYRWLMREAAARADAIVTPSESTRRDVIAHLGIGPDREASVVAIPEGVNPIYQPVDQARRGQRTILYVGRFDPYKNVVRLIDAYARLLRDIPSVRLRIIGPEDPRYPEACERARALGVERQIEWQGYIEPKALLEAYQTASLLVLASRYEGFGLPVLEAMACGTPVVCSNVSSLPEVVGDAALTVDPDDTQALCDAMARIITQPTLAEELRIKGMSRASQFTWEATARETLAIYRKLYEPS